MHLAVKADNTDVIGLLLDLGLGTQDTDNLGCKPYEYAKRELIKNLVIKQNPKYNPLSIKDKLSKKLSNL